MEEKISLGATKGNRMAARAAFFVPGFVVSGWAVLVPYVKRNLNISDAMLGLLLLCIGLGSVIGMALGSALAPRFGCRLLILISATLMCVVLPLLVTTTNILLLIGELLSLGAAIGTIEVAANMQAIIVERAAGKPMMSGFHAQWSVAGIAGSTIATVVSVAHLGPLVTACLIAVVGIMIIFSATTHHLPFANGVSGTKFTLPKRKVAFIGALCFVAFLAEGAVLDWSAIFLSTDRKMAPEQAGLGFTLFACSMAVGRLSGNKVTSIIGPRRILLWSSLTACLGLLVVALVPNWMVVLSGFAILGIGCSNLSPALYSILAKQSVMPENQAVFAVTLMAYTGILFGPAFIGFLANAFTLPIAFTFVAVSLLVITVNATAVSR